MNAAEFEVLLVDIAAIAGNAIILRFGDAVAQTTAAVEIAAFDDRCGSGGTKVLGAGSTLQGALGDVIARRLVQNQHAQNASSAQLKQLETERTELEAHAQRLAP